VFENIQYKIANVLILLSPYGTLIKRRYLIIYQYFVPDGTTSRDKILVKSILA